MTEIAYEALAQRLTPDALELFQSMASVHMESTGDRRFLRSDSMAGTRMHFVGQGSRQTFSNFDGGAVEDLLSWGLLHVEFSSRGTPNYRISGEGLHFFKWLMQSAGGAVEQVEDEVRRVLDGHSFAASHPGCAHHLREAFALLWEGRTDKQVVSEVGDHLRKALMDATTDVVGPEIGGEQEKPIQRLEALLANGTAPSLVDSGGGWISCCVSGM